MTTIGDYAIFMCESLNTIDLPDTALDIGKCGIYGCTTLASLRFSCDVRSLGSFVFGNSGANGEDIQVFGPVNATVLPAAMDSVTDYGTVLGNYNLYDCAFVLDGKLVGVSRIRAGMKLAVPDIVERQAKKIIGWSIGADGELVNIGADVMPDDTLILYGVWGYDFDYENADGGVRLTGYHGFDTDIVVPEDINGVPVVEIAVDTFGSRAGITLIANKGSGDLRCRSWLSIHGTDLPAALHDRWRYSHRRQTTGSNRVYRVTGGQKDKLYVQGLVHRPCLHGTVGRRQHACRQPDTLCSLDPQKRRYCRQSLYLYCDGRRHCHHRLYRYGLHIDDPLRNQWTNRCGYRGSCLCV